MKVIARQIFKCIKNYIYEIEVEVVYIDSESMEGKLEPPSNTVADFHFTERFKLKHQKTTLTIQPMRPLNKRNRRQLVMVDSTDTGRDIKNKLDVRDFSAPGQWYANKKKKEDAMLTMLSKDDNRRDVITDTVTVRENGELHFKGKK